MTSISSLLGHMPSLVDFLSTSSNGGSTGISLMGNGTSGTTDLASVLSGADTSGDTVSFSPEAQALVEQMQGGGPNAATQASAADSDTNKSDAQSFVAGFFNNAGIDLNSISDDTIALLKSLSGTIEDMGTAGRDQTVDTMTNQYSKGARQSYTLTGDDQHLSFLVTYDASGKPASLAVTDVKGTTAETSVITFTNGADGKPSSIHVENERKTYNSEGGLTGSTALDPEDISLYAAS